MFHNTDKYYLCPVAALDCGPAWGLAELCLARQSAPALLPDSFRTDLVGGKSQSLRGFQCQTIQDGRLFVRIRDLEGRSVRRRLPEQSPRSCIGASFYTILYGSEQGHSDPEILQPQPSQKRKRFLSLSGTSRDRAKLSDGREWRLSYQ